MRDWIRKKSVIGYMISVLALVGLNLLPCSMWITWYL